jgi:UDP-N-acetylglucosamine 4,6-dehydratase
MIDGGADSLPITDERMTRFWITLEQGVNFVLSSLEMMQGGEIFVPRIPSMKMTELAKAMAPDLKQHIIGIRPGEKLHEIMVPHDDGRNTLLFKDRYIIEPLLGPWDRTVYLKKGAGAVPDDFCYSSDGNDEWLDMDGLHGMLKSARAV